jgi:crotonobetainyl-CoA:carnitine CoA-transferase CaiB-like acyl-CoA transferase
VFHIESTNRPDGFRLQYPPFKDQQPGLNRSGCFAFFNDSKLGVTLDLKHPRGAELALRLIDRADVVIENMRPGVMERLGLGAAALRARKPSLVVLSTSNMGQTGPYATHPGFGSQLSSLSGFTEMIGRPEGPPQPLYGPYIDFIAAAYGACAVLAALVRRQRTGEGASIDVAQYETGLQFVAPQLLDSEANGTVPKRAGNADPVAAPHGAYPCAGGEWCVISCWDDAEWARLCAATGEEGWRTDPAFATAALRREHRDALNAAIGTWTRAFRAREVMGRLQAAGVHAAAVNTMRDLYEDPQLLARECWQRHEHGELGPLRYRMPCYRLSGTPGRTRSAAPCLGQHNETVWKQWLGLEADEYDHLTRLGVFA